MYRFLRPLIFHLPPEAAHNVTLRLLRISGKLAPAGWLLQRLLGPARPGPVVKAFGVTFANPVGLAAGYDKDGLGWRGLAALGFGHIELGTVTPRSQPGNPGERVFRLVKDQAIINRMGFPNRGAAFMARRLSGPRPAGLVLGVNIGKNRDTPLEDAVRDYGELVRIFAPLADYLAINVSSPNTPGLRALQTRQGLEGLLGPLAEERRAQQRALGRPVPLLVKLAPDLTHAELDDALEAITGAGMDGVIIANTSVSREGVTSPLAGESGGLSGAPVRAQRTALVRDVVRLTGARLPVIASGGVMAPEDAVEKLEAGAALVQLYTGLIYTGPGLVGQAIAACHARTVAGQVAPFDPRFVPSPSSS